MDILIEFFQIVSMFIEFRTTIINLFTVAISLFVALMAVFFQYKLIKFYDYRRSKLGLKAELKRNFEKCNKFEDVLTEQLSDFDDKVKNKEIPSFDAPKFHDDAFNYFSINGYTLNLDEEVRENIEKMKSCVDNVNTAIDRQDIIIFTLFQKKELPTNLFRNMNGALIYIKKYKSLYESQIIPNFMK